MTSSYVDEQLCRRDFPSGFVFGTASSAYQYEGGAKEGGRGPSTWDTFTHERPEKIADRSTGDVAVDSYHRYKEDVKLMKEMGVDAYRFSISWTRILPNGSLSGGINIEGIQYYNNLINELISNGVEPFVTLFHFDPPQHLEDQYGGFVSPQIVQDFAEYANVCFKEFGDRVKHWITINEPNVFSLNGYAEGIFPPANTNDSGREPYIVSHHLLLAHAEAVKVYKERYQKSQKGEIGITLHVMWMLPLSDTKADSEAAERSLDFMYGWFMDPLTQGDYPFSMRALVGNRLPKFSEEQSNLLKNSFDFIGLNYYTSRYNSSSPINDYAEKSYMTDSYVNTTVARNGRLIGPVAGSQWLHTYPQGIEDLLLYTKVKYNNPVIYITENGTSEINNATLTLEEALKDEFRIEYYRQHLLHLHKAIKKGVDVRGYFAWSLMDNFEWMDGLSVRFGIYYVDYNNDLKIYPKSSALWFHNFLKK